MSNPTDYKLMRDYKNLMIEIRLRMKSAYKAINSELDIPSEHALEFAYLQVRLMCELLALACLVAHGEELKTYIKNLQKEYSAGKIFTGLGKIHPRFFPNPISGKRTNKHSVTLTDSNLPFLDRQALTKLYNNTGNKLHRGSARNFKPSKFENEKASIELADILQKFSNLLCDHGIVMHGDNRALFANFDRKSEFNVTVGIAVTVY